MRRTRAFLIRLAGLFRHRQQDLEIAEELEFHLAMQTEENLRRGMAPEEARRRALIQAGGLELAREACRERLGLPWLEVLVQDLRYAARVLRGNPGVTAVVVITLALGIGANTALFSLVDAVLIRSLPYTDTERLVVLSDNNPGRPGRQSLVSYPNYRDWQRQTRAFTEMALCVRNMPVTLAGADGPERVDAGRTSANLFSVLGVRPLLGRAFTAEEEEKEQPVAVISYSLWQRRFAGVPDVVGRTLSADGQIATVVGVMPPEFQFPFSTTQLWMPIPAGIRMARSYAFGMVVGRMRPGATLEQAQAELEWIGRPEGKLIPLQQQITAKPLRIALWLLLGAVTFVLLIGCTNVAHLLLARGPVRQGELAVRIALGAGRGRIVGQLMAENLLLSALASLLGIPLAFGAVRALVALAPVEVPRLETVAIDGRVLFFTLTLSLLCPLVFGLAPAWRTSKCDPHCVLKTGSRGALKPPGWRLRGLLVIGECALAVVLLCGAGLMVRSLMRLNQASLGYEPRNALAFRVVMPANRSLAEEAAFYRASLDRLKTIPGVQRAGAVSFFLLNLSSTEAAIRTGATDKAGRCDSAVEDSVSPDLLVTLGVPLRLGRSFSAEDNEASPPVALASESLARRCWPGEAAVGKQFRFADGRLNGRPVRVVGIVGDMRRTGMEHQAAPRVYLPLAQWPTRGADFILRTQGDPLRLASTVRHEMASLDPAAPVYRLSTLKQRLAGELALQRFETLLLTLFAAVALFLAGIGIYGVMHYSVAQRSHEIGLRVALGASARAAVAPVMRQGLLLASAGLLLGAAGALLLTRLFAALLFDVTATDPVTFALAAVLIGATAGMACLIPAWRAISSDPMRGLRNG